jgi:hypothetical protein
MAVARATKAMETIAPTMPISMPKVVCRMDGGLTISVHLAW